MKEIGGKELRDAIARLLSASGSMTSEDVLRALRLESLSPKGADYKGRIRNIHSALTSGIFLAF